LRRGWEWYRHPTSGERAGTIFRIDGKGVRFPVDELRLETTMVKEEHGRHQNSFSIGAGLAAGFLARSFQDRLRPD
jgi:hypothetical protein